MSFRRGVGRRHRRCSPCHQYLRYPASPCHSPNFPDSTSLVCADLFLGVSGRVPEIQIPVRKRDSPDFSEFRRLSLASTDIEENPASGDLSTDIG
ncbi:uncharacterized protein MEPE_06174 [Melanopsichium pennsylvanicum]|uniref:Uncharacterized protein n=1 Tax=Melanopsichium pennsylvanicum TaxID=63383 RepID=A0AAJ5C8G0_9BASI|nr:uncharacterized protein MEPE_06174 [Melanopsichium pennsylvanicum]